ncbi:tetratricopeptide repeat protein [uncultured Nevskia sp.]|uniref:tetratricopeptide repeat protein n=1 Tax=uncultured Nevskia sp. TaxID=228950 RepID=UPI0025E6C34D|nr:tetratricopeptide repeat protein [uncultured Nevskia sp.]
MSGFLGELQRRNVHRAALFYAGAAWLLVQIATQVFPFFDIPNATVRIVVIAVVVGFPFAMLFSWFYEWTPQGIKLESEIDRSESVTRQTGKTMDRWIIAVLALAVVLLVANTVVGGKRASGDIDRSVAVLPLINESGDPANEYFSDGLSEELITALAQIGDLKVIGRSSSFRFKGGAEGSRVIGEKLGVATLLEGTVRKQGDRVRIVAELINAADGRALWSRSYDRELKDIFAVQSEIASAVAVALKSALFATAPKPVVPEIKVDAHNAYLQARFYWQRFSEKDLVKAIQYYDEAIRLEPAYAQAYAERAETAISVADLIADSGRKAGIYADALRDARKAVELAPELAEAHAALGWALFLGNWQFSEGLAELERSAQLSSSNATAHKLLGRVLMYMGRFPDAEAAARRAVEIDPLMATAHLALARVLFTMERLDEADAEARKAAELQPGSTSSHRWQVFVAVLRGDGETALREAQLEPNEGFRLCSLALAQAVRGDRAASDAALAQLIAMGEQSLAYQIAEVHAWRGDKDAAFEWLQRAYDSHDGGILSLPSDPLLKGLRSDPRYAELLAKLGLPDPGQ